MKFNEWFDENLAESASDIANHGADCGFPCITYTTDCVDLYNEFEDEIYDALNDDAENMGYGNIEEMVSKFSRSDMLSTPEQRKNLLLWYMVERRAHEIEDEKE